MALGCQYDPAVFRPRLQSGYIITAITPEAIARGYAAYPESGDESVMDIGFPRLAGAKADERQTRLGICCADPALVADRPGQILIGDKNYYGREFEAALDQAGVRLLRPARKGESDRAGARLVKPLRQTIESINETFEGQFDPELHGRAHPCRRARRRPATHPRADRRDLAQTTAPGQPSKRSLIAYDH